MNARSRRRALAGLTITTVVATASIVGTNAVAAPEPPMPLPPISEGLADLFAGGPFAAELVLVHGENIEMANRAVTESGMRKVIEFEKVGVVVAEASAAQMKTARTKPGVTYMESPPEVTLFTDTSHDATRGKETATIYNGANDEDLDGTGISIAVIDSGIDPTHPFFADGKIVANLKCDPDMGNAVGDGCLEMGDLLTDTGGHGTHVAGIAAGNRLTLSDGTQVQGAAPGARIVSLAAGDATGEFIIGPLTATNWVLENHAAPCGEDVSEDDCPPIRVTNNSYGTAGDFDPLATSVKLQRALAAEGVATVWANGNDGGDGSVNLSNQPAQDQTPGIVSVANFTDEETGVRDNPETSNLAVDSSRGLKSDSATWPDISAPGSNILSSCRITLPACSGADSKEDGDFSEISGTSMAAPHVAGAIAQLFQLKPFASPGHIEDALKDGAFKFDDPGDVEYVPVDSYTSTFDKGTGLLDVMRSADAVQPE